MFTRLLGFTLALASAAPLHAGIDSLSTTSLTTGSLLVIDGIDFGIKPAKLKLIPLDDQGKTTSLKLLQIIDTKIDAVLKKKAQAGEYMLEVTPKGGPTFVAPTTVFVRAPELVAVFPENAQPGDEVELLMRHIGDVKGKVKIGDRKAKVLDWLPGELGGGDGATDLIRVRLSKNAKKTANGPNEIEIRNRIANIVADVQLSIFGGALSTYRADIDGKAWKSASKFGFPGYDTNGLGGVSLTGFKGKFGSKKVTGLTVAIAGFDPATFNGMLPFTITGNDVNVLYSKGTGQGASFWQSSFGFPFDGAEGDNPTITITSVEGGVVSGFGQALGLIGSGGSAQGTTLDVTNFVFAIPMIPE